MGSEKGLCELGLVSNDIVGCRVFKVQALLLLLLQVVLADLNDNILP